MTASLVTVRTAILNAIADAKSQGEFVYNGFAIQVSHLPVVEVVGFPPEGRLWVVGMAWNTSKSESRSGRRTRDIPVQLAYQEPVDKVSAGYFALMDSRIELVEQIDDLVAALKIEGYGFRENVPLRDRDAGPDPLPFTFGGMRKANTFESYFTSWWREAI